MGELLYRLKYQRDRTAVEPLSDTVAAFLRTRKTVIDAILAAPPSNARAMQPVALIANAVSERLSIPVFASCLSKIGKTPQLKDLTEYHKRVEALAGAFSVSPQHTRGKRLLLFDDLFGSGAAVSAITELLKGPGEAAAVYLLTLTTK